MTYVLDTDTFSDATFGARGLRERIELERLSHEVVTSVITRLEMCSGWHKELMKATDATKVLRVLSGLQTSELFLAQFELLPFNAGARGHFERLCQDKQVKRAGWKDLLIGCIALAHTATVVTRNRKHFGLIPGLAIVDWSA